MTDAYTRYNLPTVGPTVLRLSRSGAGYLLATYTSGGTFNWIEPRILAAVPDPYWEAFIGPLSWKPAGGSEYDKYLTSYLGLFP